jgi:hypothetical protein
MQQTTISMKMLLRLDVYVSVEGLSNRSEASLIKKLLERRVFEYLKLPRMGFETFRFDTKVELPSTGLSRVSARVLTEDEAIDSLK